MLMESTTKVVPTTTCVRNARDKITVTVVRDVTVMSLVGLKSVSTFSTPDKNVK